MHRYTSTCHRQTLWDIKMSMYACILYMLCRWIDDHWPFYYCCMWNPAHLWEIECIVQHGYNALDSEYCHKYTMHKDLIFWVSSVYVISSSSYFVPTKHIHTLVLAFSTIWLCISIYLIHISCFSLQNLLIRWYSHLIFCSLSLPFSFTQEDFFGAQHNFRSNEWFLFGFVL